MSLATEARLVKIERELSELKAALPEIIRQSIDNAMRASSADGLPPSAVNDAARQIQANIRSAAAQGRKKGR